MPDEFIEELHEIREKLQKENARLSPKERIARLDAATAAMLASLGLREVSSPATWPGSMPDRPASSRKRARKAPAPSVGRKHR